jgi:hypothetical protein
LLQLCSRVSRSGLSRCLQKCYLTLDGPFGAEPNQMAKVQTANCVDEPSGRHLHRLGFLLLVTVPFIPEIAIYGLIGIARVKGCQPEQTDVCLIGAVPVSHAIGFVLKATAGFIVAQAGRLNFVVGLYLAIAGWQTACYGVLSQGWTRVWSRLLLGFAVALLFAIVPYFGLTMATSYLENENCPPANEGGFGSCRAFGSYVGGGDYNPMHDAGQLGWLVLIGAPLALGIFAVYAIWVVVLGIRSAKRRVKSA